VVEGVGGDEAGLAPRGGGATPAGPDVWANWGAALSGLPTLGAYEAFLYTDAHVTGEALGGLGPYRLYNARGAVGLDRGPVLEAGVALRVEHHLPRRLLEPDAYRHTSTAHYVGGAPLSDQLACLLSLALGARFRSGGETRTFDLDDPDPGGRPGLATHRPPTLTPAPRHTVIPGIAGRTVLLDDAVPLLGVLPRLSAADATDVQRAARLYRQALWVADDDAELAWLLLVSAVEVGATQWAGRAGEPASGLVETMPDLAVLLRASGGQALLDSVAPHLAHLTRATARFLAFVVEFGSAPPPDRPGPAWAQVDWSRIRTAAGQVYAYRSAVLHAGHPMPGPLLEVPWEGDLDFPVERPMGHGSGHGTTTWAAKDLPMHLHTFAGLARRALKAWWLRLSGG